MRDRKMRDLVMRKICSEQTPDTLLSDIRADPQAMAALEYLAAKGYVRIQRAWGREIVSIEPTAMAMTYFPDAEERAYEKRVEWIRYIITTAIAVAAFAVAVVSIVLQYR